MRSRGYDELADLLLGFGIASLVVGVVAHEADDRARRRAAFLHEAALAAQEEWRELGGRPGR